MFWPEALLGLFLQITVIGVAEGFSTIDIPRNTSQPTSTSQNNVNSLPIPTPTENACCYIVQDQITDYYWRRYTYTVTETVWGVTTDITVYPTGNVTNFQTNVFTRVNPTYRPTPENEWMLRRIKNPLRPPPAFIFNEAPGPKFNTSELSSETYGTEIVTAGVTIQSPYAFNVFSSFKILTVPAVTDENGNVACATISTYSDTYPLTAVVTTRTFTNVNSFGNAYYSGFGTCIPEIITFTETLASGAGKIPTTTATFTATITLDCTWTITDDTRPSVATEISLTTPFVRVNPPSETVLRDNEPCDIQHEIAQEMWGYLPQDVLDFVKENPYYRSQYPDIAKCIPGGPYVIPVTQANCQRPQVLGPEISLTEHEERVITPSIGSEFFPTQPPRTQEPQVTPSPSDNGPGSAQPSPTRKTDPPPVTSGGSSKYPPTTLPGGEDPNSYPSLSSRKSTDDLFPSEPSSEDTYVPNSGTLYPSDNQNPPVNTDKDSPANTDGDIPPQNTNIVSPHTNNRGSSRPTASDQTPPESPNQSTYPISSDNNQGPSPTNTNNLPSGDSLETSNTSPRTFTTDTTNPDTTGETDSEPTNTASSTNPTPAPPTNDGPSITVSQHFYSLVAFIASIYLIIT